MSWITEDVTTLLVVLFLIELALVAALYQSGRGIVVALMVGVLLIAGGASLIETMVVTERERVENTLYGVVDAAEQNNLDGVLSFVSPDALEVRTLAQSRLKLVEIKEAKVTDTPRITVNNLTSPPSATAEFTGRVQGELKMGSQYGDTFVARFNVELRLIGDEWKIVKVESSSAVPGR